jgi:hypothetical protein
MTAPIRISDALKRPLTPEAALRLFELLPPGEGFPYHRGYLPEDRRDGQAGETLGAVADAMLRLEKRGKARLVQKRLGEADYAYLVVKR